MRRIFKYILIIVFFCIAVAIALNLYVYDSGEKYVIDSIDNVPHAEAAIILGAAITNAGKPSPVLQDRVLMAIKLYKAGKVSKILMSGGNATVATDEVDPVRKVLIANEIPSADIFLDHAGFDTYSTMYRAKEVFQVNDAIIVTQEFHLSRAVYTARVEGIDAYGIAADRGTYSLKNYLRELLARPGAFIDILLRRVPKYVGPTIPITGDGSST